jgi:O-antigen/teichoic acid export membrane protein
MSKPGEVYNVPRGTAYLTTQQIITYTTYLIFYVALARILDPGEVNEIGLLLAAQAAFVALTQLGLPASATRYISSSIARNDRQTAGAAARTILRLSILVGVTGFLIATILSPFVGSSYVGTADGGSLLILTFGSGLLLDFILLFGAYFVGVGSYARSLYQNALYIPFSRGLGLLLAVLGYRVIGIILGWVVGGIVTLVLSLYLWHGRLPSHSSHPIRPLLSFSLPVFGAALIVFGQQYGDFSILNFVLGHLPSNGVYYIIVSSVSALSVLWIPVTQALYPALSASHATDGTQAISDRLAIAFRLTNLAVLPFGAALAAVAPTVIGLVYKPPYVAQANIFAILALASIFTAQGAILTTSLQAVGRARQVLIVTLTSTVIGLLVVASTARPLGTLGAAVGRIILGAGTVFLARRSMESSAKTHVGNALPTAIMLAVGVGIPLAIADYLLILVNIPLIGHLSPLWRLPILAAIFVGAFLAMSRAFRIFRASDFAILKDALPHRFHPQLRAIEHLIVGQRKDRSYG